MKRPWIITQFGSDFIEMILVYNWTFSNKVGFACFSSYSSEPYVSNESLVAIFKVKYKTTKP